MFLLAKLVGTDLNKMIVQFRSKDRRSSEFAWKELVKNFRPMVEKVFSRVTRNFITQISANDREDIKTMIYSTLAEILLTPDAKKLTTKSSSEINKYVGQLITQKVTKADIEEFLGKGFGGESAVNLAKRINREYRKFLQKKKRHPEIENSSDVKYLAEQLGFTEKNAKEVLLQHINKEMVSLSKANDDGLTLEEMIGDQSNFISDIDSKKVKEVVLSEAKKLLGKDYELFLDLLFAKKTRAQLAKEYELTTDQLSSKFKDMKRKLKDRSKSLNKVFDEIMVEANNTRLTKIAVTHLETVRFAYVDDEEIISKIVNGIR